LVKEAEDTKNGKAGNQKLTKVHPAKSRVTLKLQLIINQLRTKNAWLY
jgi:hypothetical protein